MWQKIFFFFLIIKFIAQLITDNLPVIEGSAIERGFASAEQFALVKADDGHRSFDVSMAQSSAIKDDWITYCKKEKKQTNDQKQIYESKFLDFYDLIRTTYQDPHR